MVLGPIISAGANLVSGFMSANAQSDANAQSAANARLQRETQKDFAQHGIEWRVKDAKEAGIHPLYALGANTSTYSPVSLGVTPETGLATGIANMGQDLSRAINTTRGPEARVDAFTKTVQDLSLQKMGLENELLGSQIAKLRSTTNPPMPTVGPLPPIPESGKQDDRPLLQFGGQRISTDPLTSNFDEFSKRYGDEGLPQWAIAPGIMFRDYMHTTGGPNPKDWPSQFSRWVWDGVKWIDRNVKVFGR